MRQMISLLITLVATFLTASCFATTVYVGPKEAYKTIQAGVDAAKPGDTVIVRDGVYTDRGSYAAVVLRHGGADDEHRLTIKAEHRYQAVLDGEWKAQAGFWFDKAASAGYLTIDGFKFMRFLWAGIDSAYPDPVGGATPGHHYTVQNCEFYNNCIGVAAGPWSSYITYDANVFHHEYHPGPSLLPRVSHGFYVGGQHMRITNNLIYDLTGDGGSGFGIQVKWGDVPIGDVLISSNTFARGSNQPHIVFNRTPTSNVTIQNNIFYQPVRPQPAIDFYNSSVEHVIIRNNLLYGGDRLYGTPSGSEPRDLKASDNITGDPLFVNPKPDVNDFHLKAGSPAINVGLAARSPDHDLDGKKRPAKGGYDMGAYENSGLGSRVSGSGLPEGWGLAARYPGDRGITKDKAVVFAEDFEVKDLAELKTRWSELTTWYPTDEKKSTFSLASGAPEGSPGSTALQMTATRGENQGGQIYKGFHPGYDRLFLRFYVKFADDYGFPHHFAGLEGEVVAPPRRTGHAGVKPTDRFTVRIDPMRYATAPLSSAKATYYPPEGFAPPGIWAFYTYWPDMHSWQNEDGSANVPLTEDAYYGNPFSSEPPAPVVRGRWICVEMMVKMNASPEKSDGEDAMWINGKLVGHFAPGSMRGQWSHDTFKRGEEGVPFEGFRWRTDPRVNVNMAVFDHYVTENAYKEAESYMQKHPDFRINTRQATIWFDHVVVSREYVGPLRPYGE